MRGHVVRDYMHPDAGIRSTCSDFCYASSVVPCSHAFTGTWLCCRSNHDPWKQRWQCRVHFFYTD